MWTLSCLWRSRRVATVLSGFGSGGQRRLRLRGVVAHGAQRLDRLRQRELFAGEALDEAHAAQHAAQTLLQRHGVVFRATLDDENCAPPWRELLYVYRRLEARGELRGGRFVERFAGEQFALPEAVEALRAAHRDTAPEQPALAG